ncbi:hypothetical protein Csa_023983, partial [Cucumis sativus]
GALVENWRICDQYFHIHLVSTSLDADFDFLWPIIDGKKIDRNHLIYQAVGNKCTILIGLISLLFSLMQSD